MNAKRQRPREYRRANQDGYTLIEVIVAFALLALGLGILLAILSGGVREVAWAGQATRAALYADTLMSTLGADERLHAGQRRGEFEHGNYRWTMDIVRENIPTSTTAETDKAGASTATPAPDSGGGKSTPSASPSPAPGQLPIDIGAVTQTNELYRIALELRWGDAPDQHLHIDTLRAYTPGPVLFQ